MSGTLYTQRFSEGIRSLRFWQKQAENIQRHECFCPVCHSYVYMTYTLPGLNDTPPIDETLEYCGTYCAACMFTGASARKRT